MKTQKKESLDISLQDKEIINFKSIIKKCVSEDTRIGFNPKTFNEDEVKLIKDINKDIN